MISVAASAWKRSNSWIRSPPPICPALTPNPCPPSVYPYLMPSKLLGMVASGRPVIATAESGTELARAVSCCGIVVRPDDPDALANAILELAADSERRLRLGRNAREFAVTHCEKGAVLAEFERELFRRRRTDRVKSSQLDAALK